MGQKCKVRKTTTEELTTLAAKTGEKMSAASVVQLQKALFLLAYKYVGAITSCPDEETHGSATMSVVAGVLGSIIAEDSLADLAPSTDSTN